MEQLENSQENIVISLCIIILLAGINLYRREALRGRPWVKPWIARRTHFGAYHALLQEISTEDPIAYKNFVRMDKNSFAELLELVKPMINCSISLMFQPVDILAFGLFC